MRFLIANVLRPESSVTFANFGDFVPDIYDESDASLAARPDPRVLKSHEPYDKRYPRVIYLAHELPTFRGSRPDVPFVRRSGAGAGREELTPELYEQVLAAWPEALERAGYSSPAR